MQSERKIHADINTAGDSWIQVTLSGEGAADLTEQQIEAALSAAEPVKTPFKVASEHIPEARVSLLSRVIRQGLNDYGWKNFGTLPEVLMGYIIQAEKAEADAHPRQPRDCGHDGGDLSERRDNIGSAYTRTALSAQVQDVAGWKATPHEPTQEMLAAAMKADQDGMPATMKEIWMHMWAAYAAAPAKQEGGETAPVHKHPVENGESGDK